MTKKNIVFLGIFVILFNTSVFAKKTLIQKQVSKQENNLGSQQLIDYPS
jgi:hypothetical protein